MISNITHGQCRPRIASSDKLDNDMSGMDESPIKLTDCQRCCGRTVRSSQNIETSDRSPKILVNGHWYRSTLIRSCENVETQRN
jgi:hypothetical protein